MTLNQVAYWTLVEAERSNKERERETNRHNVAYEEETKRHNVAGETENVRHNKASEYNQYLSAMAAQSSAAAAHRQADIAATRVANDYELGLKSAEIAQQNADTNEQNANTNARNSKINQLNYYVGKQANLLREREIALKELNSGVANGYYSTAQIVPAALKQTVEMFSSALGSVRGLI